MKIIIILWLLPFYLFSQNNEPQQQQFTIDTTLSEGNSFDSYLSSNMDYFSNHHFVLGWHWGYGKK